MDYPNNSINHEPKFQISCESCKITSYFDRYSLNENCLLSTVKHTLPTVQCLLSIICCLLSKQLQTVMTVADCQDNCKHFQNIPDMFVLVCLFEMRLNLVGGANTMACLSGKGHSNKKMFLISHLESNMR